jgi:hypothetical protein
LVGPATDDGVVDVAVVDALERGRRLAPRTFLGFCRAAGLDVGGWVSLTAAGSVVEEDAAAGCRTPRRFGGILLSFQMILQLSIHSYKML